MRISIKKDREAGVFTVGQARQNVIFFEDAPIVMSAKGNLSLFFGVLLVEREAKSERRKVLGTVGNGSGNANMVGRDNPTVLGKDTKHGHFSQALSAPSKRIPA